MKGTVALGRRRAGFDLMIALHPSAELHALARIAIFALSGQRRPMPLSVAAKCSFPIG
jgi:hypothetical protein